MQLLTVHAGTQKRLGTFGAGGFQTCSSRSHVYPVHSHTIPGFYICWHFLTTNQPQSETWTRQFTLHQASNIILYTRFHSNACWKTNPCCFHHLKATPPFLGTPLLVSDCWLLTYDYVNTKNSQEMVDCPSSHSSTMFDRNWQTPSPAVDISTDP